jgi:putative ABC transport system ATP-binding protein
MILLADEPTGNLDSRQSGRVTELLRSLARDSQQTIVMVTHDAQVARAAFRLVKFRDGNIEADLTRDEFSANASAFRVAAGESPTDAA